MGWLFRTDEDNYLRAHADEKILENMAYGAHSSHVFDQKAGGKQFVQEATSSGLLSEKQAIAYWEDHKDDADNLADALGANDWGDPPAGYPLMRVLLSWGVIFFLLLCIYAAYVWMFADFFSRLPAWKDIPIFCIKDTCYWWK